MKIKKLLSCIVSSMLLTLGVIAFTTVGEQKEEIVYAEETASLNIESYADDNSWNNGTAYKDTISIDSVVSVTPSGTGYNCKYYTDGESLRFYDENGKLSFSTSNSKNVLCKIELNFYGTTHNFFNVVPDGWTLNNTNKQSVFTADENSFKTSVDIINGDGISYLQSINVYYDSTENIFNSLNLSTKSSLCANYKSSTDNSNDLYTLSYGTKETTKMTGKNDASLLGLDPDKFEVIGAKGNHSLFPGLNKEGYIALYYNANGSNEITIKNNNKIHSISITYKDELSNAYIMVNGENKVEDNGLYVIDSSSFTIGNNNTSNIQVQIQSITIQVYSYEIKNNSLTSLRFGAFIPAALKENLDSLGTTEYGIAYKLDSSSDAYTHKSISGVFVENGGDSTAVEEKLDAAVTSNHYYQFALTINNIPATEFDTVIDAKAYVKIDDTYYYMQEASYSVNSLAAYYVSYYSEDENVKNHLGMLNWLSKYKEAEAEA